MLGKKKQDGKYTKDAYPHLTLCLNLSLPNVGFELISIQTFHYSNQLIFEPFSSELFNFDPFIFVPFHVSLFWYLHLEYCKRIIRTLIQFINYSNTYFFEHLSMLFSIRTLIQFMYTYRPYLLFDHLIFEHLLFEHLM